MREETCRWLGPPRDAVDCHEGASAPCGAYQGLPLRLWIHGMPQIDGHPLQGDDDV